jgi:hypothetical protein
MLDSKLRLIKMQNSPCHPQKEYYAKGLCKQCYETGYRREHRNKNRYHQTKYLYGVTKKIYDSLLEKQNFLCPVCLVDLRSLPPKQVCIDHDHQTEEVRGILCRKCNGGIGLLDDDADNLLRAISYLSIKKDAI